MAITDKLTAIADAIRLKRDITDEMTLDDMPMQIGLIEGGGSDIKIIKYTPEVDVRHSNGVKIVHGLGRMPKCIVGITNSGLADYEGSISYMVSAYTNVGVGVGSGHRKNNGTISSLNGINAMARDVTDYDFTISTASTSYWWKAGEEITFYVF